MRASQFWLMQRQSRSTSHHTVILSIAGRLLDSRFRGNADYWRGVFNERQQETIA
jgi:hypothetical protein